jgi:hypothetical protein
VGDAFEFLDAERKFVFEVVGALRIKRAVLVGHGEDMDFRARNADGLVPGEPLFLPLLEPLGPVPGLTKNSSSICSNSRERKVKLRGLISLRNALPICAMPKGSFLRDTSSTFLNWTNIACAVSGRR